MNFETVIIINYEREYKMYDIYKLHADICKTLANPKRLEIINILCDGEMTASQLLEKINISKTNLSQHMSILIEKGVVISHRQGKNVFYQLTDKKIIKACDIMREVLINRLKKDNQILKKIEYNRNN